MRSDSSGTRRPDLADRRKQALAGRLQWLIAIRLVVVTSVLLPYLLVKLGSFARGEVQTQFDFLLPVAGITYAASLVYILLLRLLAERPVLLAYTQFCGDLLLITGLVYHFGGVASPFSIFYLIVVTLASTMVSRSGGYLVAAVAWLLYATTVIGLFYGWVPSAPEGEATVSSGRLLYSLFMHLFGFYAVAFMTSRMAQSVLAVETELAEREEDLADLQIAYLDIIRSVPSGLITTDAHGLVSSANPAASRILGRPQAELVGWPVSYTGLFDSDQWERLRSEPEAADRRRREIEIETPDGTRLVGFSVSPLTSADARPIGNILIFQDLSEFRKLQEALQLKDRMAAVGELGSGLAHEIGNPLTAISGSVQMLSADFDGGTPQRKLLDIIRRESQRLDRTIKGFLKFARPQEKTSVPFDIAALLTEHVELLGNSSEVSDHHRLELELEPSSTSIVADPDQISQIFWNLARNALRAMPDGGTLTIRGDVRGQDYWLAFEDTGRGMTEEERAGLFHPYRSFFDGGVGIGMAIVYRIVEEHRGRLDVNSRAGRGTVITVELPRSVQVAEPTAAEV